MQTKSELSNAVAFFDKGVAQYRTGDLTGAIASFVGVASLKENRALQFDPDNADTYGYRCVARHRLGDLPGAISDCQRAATLALEQGNDREYEYAIEILAKLEDLMTTAA
jgi:tetratricopeptide (TPR) repeat protein